MFKPFNVAMLLAMLLPSTIDLHDYRVEEYRKPERASPQPQGLLKCEDAKVQYAPFDKAYAKRIIFRAVSDTENPPLSIEKEYSPESNMWQVAVDPDTTKPGPWSKSIYFGSDSNEEVWKLTFIDQIGVDTRW